MNDDRRILAVSFEGKPFPERFASALKRMGLMDLPDRRIRRYGSNFLVAYLDDKINDKKLDALRDLTGVRRISALPSGGLVARRRTKDNSVITLPNGTCVGRGGAPIIAGPCSVESERQICEIAALVKEAGAAALRGGAFKPRTAPYSFGGLGERGLEYLALARERTGLPIVTEALDIGHLDLVARYADVIQVGSRNMHNAPFLFQLGAHPLGKPVLLKRGFGATVEEFLFAAEHILLGRFSTGRDDADVILCERGIRTFETSTRFTLDIGAVAVLQEKTHLPVIVDPSHPAGDRRYVPPLARAAVAAGAGGLLVEVHPDPDRAWSDARQSLDPFAFREMMGDLKRIVELRLDTPAEAS